MKYFSNNDIKSMDKRYRVKFINSLSGFKSANLIGTKDNDQSNLAIISSVVHLGASPALIGFVSRPNTVARHTLENIINSKTFTINNICESIYKKAHQTSARYDRDESEFEECGIEEEYINNFSAPFVKESPLKIAVNYLRHIDIKENDTIFVIGEIVGVYTLENAIEDDGHINLDYLNTLAVSGLDSYHKTSLLARLPYAKK